MVVTRLRRIVPLIALSVPTSYVLWVIFVGSFSLHELLVGIIATFLAVLGMCVIDVQYPARFSPSMRELLPIWRLPWYLVSGTWEVLKVAATDLVGTDRAESLFRIVEFDAGGKNNACSVARRVLAVMYTTMAPNFIILGINTDSQEMLFHQIKGSSVPKMTQRLGARP